MQKLYLAIVSVPQVGTFFGAFNLSRFYFLAPTAVILAYVLYTPTVGNVKWRNEPQKGTARYRLDFYCRFVNILKSNYF